jgi:hypothetical protein
MCQTYTPQMEALVMARLYGVTVRGTDKKSNQQLFGAVVI